MPPPPRGSARPARHPRTTSSWSVAHEGLRPGEVEVAGDVEQVGAHRLRHLARRRPGRCGRRAGARSVQRGRPGAALVGHEVAVGRVASQNSDSEGASSRASACSIRLFTGAKPRSQAAKTSGRSLLSSTKSFLRPHRSMASPGRRAPAKTWREGVASSRPTMKCRLWSSQGSSPPAACGWRVVAFPRPLKGQRHRLAGEEAQAVLRGVCRCSARVGASSRTGAAW